MSFFKSSAAIKNTIDIFLLLSIIFGAFLGLVFSPKVIPVFNSPAVLAASILFALTILAALIMVILKDQDFQKIILIASAILLILSTARLMYNLSGLWNFTIDDSFITYRYSANLAAGWGPTYNKIPPRAEGYTTFLWMIIMVLPHLVGVGVVTFAKILSIISALLTLALIIKFILSIGGQDTQDFNLLGASAICLFFASLPEAAIHTISGMETALYTLLITLFILLIYLGNRDQPNVLKAAPLVGLLAGLTRPDANLIVIILLAYSYIQARQKKEFASYAILFYILPGVIYFLWRLTYYGVLLPLPYYIKASTESFAGFPQVSSFLIFIFYNLGLFIAICLVENRKAVFLILLALIPYLFFYSIPFHQMGYNWRYLYPTLPVIVVLAGQGIASLLAGISRLKPDKRPVLPLIALPLIVILIFLGNANLERTDEVLGHKLEYADGLSRNHIYLGSLLNGFPHDAVSPVLVVKDAGAFAYYSDWYTVDTIGLNDKSIALGEVDTLEYAFEHEPDILVLTSNDAEVFTFDSPLAHAYFQASLDHGMVPVIRSAFYQQDYIWVMAKPESDIAAYLASNYEEP